MKQFHKIFMLFAAMLIGLSHAFATGGMISVKQIIFVSGGSYGATGNMVKFYTYDPSTKKATAFDSIRGNYTNAAVVSAETIYVSVDTFLYRYNANTYKKIDSLVLPGINHMSINGNYLVVSRSYPATSNYVEIFNKYTMQQVYTDTKVKQSCNNILFLRDTAYIAESSSDSGRIAVMDLTGSAPKFVRELNLDTNAINIQDLSTDGNFIYTYSYGYTPSFSIAATRANAYEIITGTHKYLSVDPKVTNVVGSMLSFTGSLTIFGNVNNKYQSFGELGFNSSNTSQALTSISTKAYTNGILDTVNSNSYLISNDYFTNAHVYRMDNVLNTYSDSFVLGVSTQAVAVDYRDIIINGIESAQISTIDFSVYPNPANSILNVSLPAGEKYKVTVLDMTGKEMMSTNTTDINTSMNISGLPNGVYLMRVQNNNNTGVQRFIKQ